MFLIRRIEKKDTDAFINLAFEAGIGITSMPKNRDALLRKVAKAERSFAKEVKHPKDENYLFLLEETDNGIIGGASGIMAELDAALYFYRLETIQQRGSQFHEGRQIPLMRVIHYDQASSEIGSLYLSPSFRKEGLGRLLSLSRFLFIACFPERFDKLIFASMRGYIDKNLVSPFWEGIGRHFIDLEFTTLMQLKDEETLDIAQTLPEYPIYIGLLPDQVQEMIGKVHPHTLPALHMLTHEGFSQTEDIDVFDGGPRIEAETSEIRTIQASIVDTVAHISTKPLNGPRYILCNNRIDFKACYAHIQREGSKGIYVSAHVAENLNLQVGDVIRYVSPSWEEGQQIKESLP